MKNTLFNHLKLAKSLEKCGIYIMPSETNQNMFYALIIGSKDTPYQGGFFMFLFNFSKSYPDYPPEVTFLNVTVFNRGRIHPNCYHSQSNGKVCLSLIGTWGKNTWDPQTSSIGEILLALLAIVFVNDPLQEGEPPYKHPLWIRNQYTYSVTVLTYLDYIIGTVSKMRDGSFQHEYIEPFKDIILEYFEENRPMYIKMYNELVVNTKNNMIIGRVTEDGYSIQAFYQIKLMCNLEKIEKAFIEAINPVEADGIIIHRDVNMELFNALKCHEILKKGTQCKNNNNWAFFCKKHGTAHPNITSVLETPSMVKIFGLGPPKITENAIVLATTPMPSDALKCCAITVKGTPCSFNKKYGDFCGKHTTSQPVTVVTPIGGSPPTTTVKCCAKTAKGTQCSFNKTIGNFCGNHKNTQKFGVV